MGWFGKKNEDGAAPRARQDVQREAQHETLRNTDLDLAARVASLAVAQFADAGMPVTVADGTAGPDTTLITDGKTRYPLFNLINRARTLAADDVPALVAEHVATLVEAAAASKQLGDTEDLTDEQWRELVRVRLMPSDAATAIGATYPRTIAGDLVQMVCLDYPTHVSFLSDSSFGGRDIDELARAGLDNVMAEPIDTVREVQPGIWLIGGDSPYIATKALDLGALAGTVLPEAPLGFVFGVPHRHAIIALAVAGVESFQQAAHLTAMTAANSGDDSPGGGLSPSSFYWRDGTIDLAGSLGDDGSVQFVAGRFADLIQEFMDAAPVQPDDAGATS